VPQGKLPGEVTSTSWLCPAVKVPTKVVSKLVSKVLLAEDVYYPGESEVSEFYVSVLLDREKGRNVIIYSTEGGMDIETVAENTPHLIFKEEIDPRVGIQAFQSRKIAFNLGLSGEAFKQMTKFVTSLYAAYEGCDASMFEINPVLKTSDNKIIAVDAKVSLDDNALFRHPEYAAMRDFTEEDPTEVEADAEAEAGEVTAIRGGGCCATIRGGCGARLAVGVAGPGTSSYPPR
jgi:succinyl-CoA synthetase beta subunit